jgi:hypothetical protein
MAYATRDHNAATIGTVKEMSMAVKKFDLKKALAGATKQHLKGAKANAGGGLEEFDDGTYLVKSLGGSLGQSNSSDRFQATMRWKFMEGDYKGKTYASFQGLEDERGWTFFLGDLGRLGYDVGEIEDFAEVLPILDELKEEKPLCRITLKTKGDFQNVRNIRLVDGEDEGEDGDEEDEDDAPKKKTKKKKVADEEEESDEDGDDDEEEEEGGDDDGGDEEEEDGDDSDEDNDEEEEDGDEDGDEEEDEEEVALSVGSTVKVKTKLGVKKAEVLEVDEKNNKIKVKTTEGKTITLSAEKIVSVEDVPAKSKKKPAAEAPKKTAKKVGPKKKVKK